MNAYDLASATRPLAKFIDDLSTWYLRRSRDRMKEGDKDAFATLSLALREFAKTLAPFAPFIAEHLWQELKREGDAESVHLENWGESQSADHNLISNMRIAREIASRVLEQRDELGIKVRQPLSKVVVSNTFMRSDNPDLEPLKVVVAEEVNVEEIVISATVPAGTVTLAIEITDELREKGALRGIIREIQAFRKEQKLNPKDRAEYHVQKSAANADFIEMHREQLQKETNTDIVIE